jgi:salicylate hydroxylase
MTPLWLSLWTATAFSPQHRHHRSPFLPALEASSGKLSDQDADVDVDVVIIGGGLVGLATAVALARRGISKIQIYERASSLRPIGAAIGLYPNGLTALEYISPQVATQVQETCIPSRYFVRRDLQNRLVRETDVRNIQATSPVMFVWYQLQRLLYEALPDDDGILNLGCTLDSFQVLETDASDNGEENRRPVQVCISRRYPSGEVVKETKTAKVLIGADGIQSTVRTQLFGKQRQLYYHGKIMYRSVLDLHTLDIGTCPPPGTQLSFQGDERGKSFSIRETSPGVVTVTAAALCDAHLLKSMLEISNNLPAKEDTTKSSEELGKLKKKRFQDLFSDYPVQVQHVLDRLDAAAIHEDAIRDIEVEPKWSKGPVTLIGDAAHAMTPHMGQGANQGLEDVCHLVHELVPVLLAQKNTNTNTNTNSTASSISEALARFWKSRIERVQEIHKRSRQNSVESNTFDKESAATPFERRKYSESFQDRLYNWKPPID